MKILALDTSTEACSAAVYADKQVYAQFALTPREHTRLILPMVEKVLGDADLRLQDVDAIAVGRGPGAFTGIRIGVGVAQGLAMAADKPILPVSTLAALAQQAYVQQGATQVLAALDARMQEVYWGQYSLKDGIMQLQGKSRYVHLLIRLYLKVLHGLQVGMVGPLMLRFYKAVLPIS